VREQSRRAAAGGKEAEPLRCLGCQKRLRRWK
jgi:hypothetical protein